MNGDVDLHLTLLFGWLVKTVGKALLLGFGVGLLVALVGAFAMNSPSVVMLGIGIGPVVSAIVLWTSDAPMPVESPED